MADEKEQEKTSTDGPGEVAVDEPTKPALSGEKEDEFDKQAERQEPEDS